MLKVDGIIPQRTITTFERMKPYEKYKESGVEWIGEIPEHWKAKKIKRLTTVNRGASPRPIDDPIYFDDNGEYSWVRIKDVTASERYLEKTEESLSELGASKSVKLEPNNLFLSIAGSVGKPIINKVKCCIHDGFVYFPTLHLDKEFLYYIFTTGELYKGLGKLGTQLNLNTETVGSITLPIPSDEEIQQIVCFLDHQTAIIDELIEKKIKQIALLKEKRQAIINETVTKGLDPTARMKDSGVEWLGEIPESWVGTKMKFLGSFINGYAFKSDEFLNNGTLRVIKISNIQHMEFDWADESFVNSKYLYDNMPCQVRKGDLVFALTRPIISTGIKASVVDFDEVMVLNQRNAIFRSNSNVLMSWIYYTMLSHQFIEQFDSKIDKTGQQPNISTSDISNISITLPPIKVQEEICEILKVKIKNIAYSESQIRLAIEKLKEYRQSLISEAVTGKIDVRGWGK